MNVHYHSEDESQFLFFVEKKITDRGEKYSTLTISKAGAGIEGVTLFFNHPDDVKNLIVELMKVL